MIPLRCAVLMLHLELEQDRSPSRTNTISLLHTTLALRLTCSCKTPCLAINARKLASEPPSQPLVTCSAAQKSWRSKAPSLLDRQLSELGRDRSSSHHTIYFLASAETISFVSSTAWIDAIANGTLPSKQLQVPSHRLPAPSSCHADSVQQTSNISIDSDPPTMDTRLHAT